MLVEPVTSGKAAHCSPYGPLDIKLNLIISRLHFGEKGKSWSGVENQHMPTKIPHFPLLVFGHFIEMTYTKKVNNVPTVEYTLFCQHGQEVWIGLGSVTGMRFWHFKRTVASLNQSGSALILHQSFGFRYESIYYSFCTPRQCNSALRVAPQITLFPRSGFRFSYPAVSQFFTSI